MTLRLTMGPWSLGECSWASCCVDVVVILPIMYGDVAACAPLFVILRGEAGVLGVRALVALISCLCRLCYDHVLGVAHWFA